MTHSLKELKSALPLQEAAGTQQKGLVVELFQTLHQFSSESVLF